MPPTLIERIGQAISPSFPSRTTAEPETERSVSVYLDTQTQGAFDADGLANDFAGTGHFIVSETTGHDGWFGNKRTVYRTKRFSFFLKNGADLVLRELNPTQALNARAGLVQVPAMPGASSPKSGQTHRPATFEEAQRWSASVSAIDPISAYIGNIDVRPGNEVQFWRGVQSLGIVNLFSDIFPPPSPPPTPN